MRKVNMSIHLWLRLIYGLRKRGKGIMESGGFLLLKPNSTKVSRIVFYDQFDKSVSDSGIIQFKGGHNFYTYLLNEGLEVYADIHTHPRNNTNQSESDKRHPMIRIKGHIAIIAPVLAKDILTMPWNCSFYEYLGCYRWVKLKQSAIPINIKLI